MDLTLGSLFSGMGGFDLAAERTGWDLRWTVEIDASCQQVLKARFPKSHLCTDVRLAGAAHTLEARTQRAQAILGCDPDQARIAAQAHTLEPVNAICGGFPCQGLSVAGVRGGLNDARSGLFYEMSRIADEMKAPWLVWENVPGLLTGRDADDDTAPATDSGDEDDCETGRRPVGDDTAGSVRADWMGAVLRELARIGYGNLGWRVLDSQYFGLAQRRRRVFGVCARNGAGAEGVAEVLSIAKGMRGDPAPRRKEGETYSGTLEASAGGCDENDANQGRLIPEISGPLGTNARGGFKTTDLELSGAFIPEIAHTLTGEGHDASEDGTGRGIPLITGTVTAKWHKGGGPAGDECYNLVPAPMAVHITQDPIGGDISPCLSQGNKQGTPTIGVMTFQPHDAMPMAVRRLTPTEVLRLQGFPDDWFDGLGLSDSVKYRMCGNAVSVPVVQWILARLSKVIMT